MLPEFLRRKVFLRQETVYPNQKKSIISKVFNDDNNLKKIARTVKTEGMETDAQILTNNQEVILTKQKKMEEDVKAIAEQLFNLSQVVMTIPGIAQNEKAADEAAMG